LRLARGFTGFRACRAYKLNNILEQKLFKLNKKTYLYKAYDTPATRRQGSGETGAGDTARARLEDQVEEKVAAVPVPSA
jgi:hypothetical protein